jgi:hypothetical protein
MFTTTDCDKCRYYRDNGKSGAAILEKGSKIQILITLKIHGLCGFLLTP